MVFLAGPRRVGKLPSVRYAGHCARTHIFFAIGLIEIDVICKTFCAEYLGCGLHKYQRKNDSIFAPEYCCELFNEEKIYGYQKKFVVIMYVCTIGMLKHISI